MWHQWWCKLIRGRQLYYLPQNTVVLNEGPNTHWTTSLHSVFIKWNLNLFISTVWFCSDASTHSSSTNRHLLQQQLRADYRGELIRLGSAIRRALDWQLKSCKVTVYLYLRGPHHTACGIINTSCKQHISHGNNHVMVGGILPGVAWYSLQYVAKEKEWSNIAS